MLEPWLLTKLQLISQKTKLVDAIRYTLSRWQGLCLLLDDVRVEIANNVVERAIRPLSLTARTPCSPAPTAVSNSGAVITSLIETHKLRAYRATAELKAVA